jgi:hypothetical protein
MERVGIVKSIGGIMWHIRRDEDHALITKIENEEDAEQYLEDLHTKKQEYSYYKHYVAA